MKVENLYQRISVADAYYGYLASAVQMRPDGGDELRVIVQDVNQTLRIIDRDVWTKHYKPVDEYLGNDHKVIALIQRITPPQISGAGYEQLLEGWSDTAMRLSEQQIKLAVATVMRHVPNDLFTKDDRSFEITAADLRETLDQWEIETEAWNHSTVFRIRKRFPLTDNSN